MPEGAIDVVVAWSPGPREVVERALRLPAGTTLQQALQACGIRDAGLDGEPMAGVWGRKQPGDHVLRDGDRVEAYRPLRVDPKVARRERFSKQGKRSAGLFAQRRAGGKAGY